MGRGLARESSVTPHGASFQCSTRSAGQLRRGLVCQSVMVEVFDTVIGVAVRLVVISDGHSPNFVRNIGYMKIIMEQFVTDAPRCIYYSSETFRLESLNRF